VAGASTTRRTGSGAASRRGAHPTILDVAERAGVSKSLVSLVLRNAPSVSDERREAVLRAAEELGYRPNAVARSLVSRRSSVIGVVLSDLHNPFFVEVVDGIQEEAAAAAYRALYNTGARSPAGEASAVETLLQLRTDGVVLVSTVLSGPEILEVASTTPVVLVARPSRWPTVDSVTNDDQAGARLAVEHLASLGHRRIAHIDGGAGAGAAARRTGFLGTMRGLGLRSQARVVPGAYTEEGGAAGVAAVLRSGTRPTAIFAANDIAAVGALQALEEHGLKVPDEVSLVGYDNTSLAALGHIGLTTIDQPRREMGAKAIRLLLERIAGERHRARHVVVQPGLVVRRTTASPARAGEGRRRATGG
jgi:DNA-binding LacI/PurR family transcriptional regulator